MPEAPVNTPVSTPVSTPTNPFAAPGVGVHYDRGRPYHHGRTLERLVTMVGAAPLRRGLDVACGTGMSTVALAGHAEAVFGVDVSTQMMRSARPAPNVHYLLGRAELLPFRDASFDAATCCSGVHWFDQPRFFAELHRVLRPNGWVGLYDHYFTGEMPGVPGFADWLQEALARYPLPPRNPQVGDPRSMEPPGFEKIGDDLFADDIEMTHADLTGYQLTISNFVAAGERGASRAELEAWALESTAPLFAGAATRTVRFLGSITCFRRLP
jgi:SAM-dependent methyltransferase